MRSAISRATRGSSGWRAAARRKRPSIARGLWLPLQVDRPRLVTDIPLSRPTPTLDLTPGISGRLLYLAGEDDFLIDAGQRRQIAQALRAAGTDHEVVSYPGAAHAFWWPGTAEFHQQARQDAWGRILALLADSRSAGQD